MRQKFSLNITTLRKIFVWVLFFTLGFLNFGLLNHPADAQFGCSYNLKSFGTDKQSYYATETVKFNALLEVSNDVTSCIKNLRFKYSVQVYKLYVNEGNSYYEKSQIEFKPIGQEDVTLNGVYAESKNFQFSLSRLNFSEEVPNPNRVVFKLDVTDRGLIYDSSVLSSQNNTQLGVNVSGVGLGPTGGGYKVNLYIDPAASSYKTPDIKEIAVHFSLSPIDAQKVAWDVDVVTKVNGKVVGKWEKFSKSRLSDQGYNIQKIAFTAANGFKNGPNVITVEMNVAGSPNAKVASGSINLQAEGFAATGGGASTTPSSSTQPGNQSGQGQPGNQPGSSTQPGNQPGTGNGDGSGVDCSGPNPDPKYCLYNPLPSGDLITMFMVITRGFLAIIAIVAVLFVIIGGFRMVISQGNEEAYTKAKQTVTWAIIGVIVASLSFSIVSIVQNLLKTNVKTVEIQNKQGN